MRARTDPSFSEYLMRIGNGKEKFNPNEKVENSKYLIIPFTTEEQSLDELFKRVFPKIIAFPEVLHILPVQLPDAVLMQKSSTVDYVIYQSATLFGDATNFLPLIYLKNCFAFDTFFAADVRKFMDGEIFVAHSCPNLTKLNISGCSTFNDGAIANLAEHCQNLSVLNLFGCIKAITDKPLKLYVLTSQMTTKMTLTTPYRLLVITITECTLHVNLGWCDKVGNEGVMSLVYRCPNLRALDLCGCLLIIVFGKEIPNLRSSNSTVSVECEYLPLYNNYGIGLPT
ncbi:hypothetical protein BC332_07942 [Capsicum chinense]|nr:hypothetical protein BC332_07942 [Capsicum chinense]